METWMLITIGTIAFTGGLIGSIHYKKVHRMFLGGPFEDAPAEFLLLPLWVFTGLGGLFLVLGFFG